MHTRQEGWECRHFLGRLHPANDEGVYRTTKRAVTFDIEKKTKLKKKERRQEGGDSRRLAKIAAREARTRQKEALVAVATYIMRTLAVRGKNGYGHDESVLAKGRQLGCDFVCVQETQSSGSTTFRGLEYRFYVQVRHE